MRQGLWREPVATRSVLSFLKRNRPGRRAALGIEQKGIVMIWTVVLILVILWALGFAVHIGGGLIHLLLVVALVVVVVRLIQGRRVV
jgi:hypothetical protein